MSQINKMSQMSQMSQIDPFDFDTYPFFYELLNRYANCILEPPCLSNI